MGRESGSHALTVSLGARFALILAVVLSAAPIACLGQSHVIVVRRGWHIDIGFAAADIGTRLQFVARALPSAHYIFFGFGDMHYLESRSHGASTLAAALWPGRGIMLVTSLDGTPQQGFGAQHVIELALSDAQSSAMQDFIVNSFITVNGSADVYEAGPYPGSVYFLARPRYSALHTCNTWASQALQAAPLHVHHGGVLFAGQVWSQARRLQRLEAAENREVDGSTVLNEPPVSSTRPGYH